MNRQEISYTNVKNLISIFIIGTSTLYSFGSDVGNDLWLVTLISIIIIIPIILILARFKKIFPENNLFEIIEICFGKIVGRIINLFFSLFFFYTVADVIRNFCQFVTLTSLTRTPILILISISGILAIFVAKKGVNVLARLAGFFLIIIFLALSISILFLVPEMKLSNIKPILYKGWKPVLKAVFFAMSYPFAETSVILGIFDKFKINNNKNVYKIFVEGYLIGCTLIFILSSASLFTIGSNLIRSNYYSNYAAYKFMRFGNLSLKIEIVISVVFTIGAILKISMYMVATCKGLAYVFNISNYKFIVTAVGLNIIILSYIAFEGVIHYFEFDFVYWGIIAFPWQIVLILILFIVSEIRYGYFKKVNN